MILSIYKLFFNASAALSALASGYVLSLNERYYMNIYIYIYIVNSILAC